MSTSKTALVATFIWIGMVLAISFMEAWLKFRAPGITLALGLGIGRLVFNVLNKVEWVLAIIILLQLLFSKQHWAKTEYFAFYLPVGILLLQTFWLLPALDARAALHISGPAPPPSNHHIYFVAMELTKTICLFVFGISLLKRMSVR